MTNIISIQDQNTWPVALKNLLCDNFELLCQYNAKEISYYDLSYIEKQYFRNEYADEYFSLIDKIAGIVNNNHIVVYHCTRLLPIEIDDIRDNGLRTLSKNLLVKKLNFAIASNAIDKQLSAYILNKHLSDEKGRHGLLHFTCAISSLSREGGVGKFFKSWGGENVFNLHETDPVSFETIKSIGNPCIIKARLLPEEMRLDYFTLSKKLIYAFLESHAMDAEDESATDACIYSSLPAEKILDIVTMDHDEFSKLTEYEQWRVSLM